MFYTDEIILRDNQIKKFEINQLVFWIEYRNFEIFLSFKYHDNYHAFCISDCDKSEGSEEEKYVIGQALKAIKIVPFLPDKPILTEFLNATSVFPGEKITLFEQVPLLLNIQAVTSQKTVDLKQLSIVKLTHTWLGDYTDGELCYYDTAEAIFQQNMIEYQSGAAICPIEINNHSEKKYLLKQLVIRTEFLSIFLHQEFLWTNKMKIDYYGEEKENAIQIVDDYANDPQYIRLNQPREDIKQSQKLFHRLSNFRSLIS